MICKAGCNIKFVGEIKIGKWEYPYTISKFAIFPTTDSTLMASRVNSDFSLSNHCSRQVGRPAFYLSPTSGLLSNDFSFVVTLMS